MRRRHLLAFVAGGGSRTISTQQPMLDRQASQDRALEARVSELLGQMSLAEKIGQMWQVNVGDSHIQEDLAGAVRAARVGSVLNSVDVGTVNELQRIAVEESRLGIPLLVGRDVIHGFRTVMPIPFGQAASWNPELVRRCAREAAIEASASGVNWTFAPMIDVSRDPRWGRIAESFGEDPHLTAVLGAAMVQGFQGNDLANPDSIAACGKHFAGYGAAESGRDYATTNVPENEMRNVYLRPFHAAVDAGVATIMTSFSDIDGVPATANRHLLTDILREEWGFDGLVVSDWDSVRQLCVHGLTANDRDAAFEAASAGVDIEMHGDAYTHHLEGLVTDGQIEESAIDRAAAAVLRVKFRLGLFERPYVDLDQQPSSSTALDTAKLAAAETAVLLKNDAEILPLDADRLGSLAVIGPLAAEPRDQLGTWIFDGDPGLSTTPLAALRDALGENRIQYAPALETSRSRDTAQFEAAADVAKQADTVILFIGEEAILSGEAHSRADIGLPGAQVELARRIHRAGKPVVAVIMAGRPLVLTDLLPLVHAILFMGHPGTMAGPAIADLLLGLAAPLGKLPASMPRMVGQVPIYYSQKNTGKPPSPESVVLIDDIDKNADQLSTGLTAYHLDAGYTPLYPFGFGLTYTHFHYQDLRVSDPHIRVGDTLTVSVTVTNVGQRSGSETVQLYIRDLVGNVTRPVRELKAFQRIDLAPGEQLAVQFQLHTDELAFYGRDNTRIVEAGEFHVWIGGSSDTELRESFFLHA